MPEFKAKQKRQVYLLELFASVEQENFLFPVAIEPLREGNNNKRKGIN